MKTFLKSFALGVLMLLAVQLKAENKPEIVANVPSEPVVTTTIADDKLAESKDVQQIPCVIIWSICNFTYTQYVGNVDDCEKRGLLAAAVMNFYNAMLGCD